MKTRPLALLCAAMLATLAAAVPIQAAEAAVQAAVPDRLHVQLWPETETNIFLLESATYSKSTPLPIDVKMAIPKGTQVFWVGEIMGGAPSNDIKSKYRINPKKDYDEVAFTLRKSRDAQVEAGWLPVQRQGNESSVKLSWVQRYPAGTVDFGFKAPAQNSTVKMTPTWRSTTTDRNNLRSYITAPMQLLVGQKVELKISYTGQPGKQAQQGQGSQGGQATGQGGSSSDSGLIIFLALVGGAAVAVLIFAKIRKSG